MMFRRASVTGLTLFINELCDSIGKYLAKVEIDLGEHMRQSDSEPSLRPQRVRSEEEINRSRLFFETLEATRLLNTYLDKLRSLQLKIARNQSASQDDFQQVTMLNERLAEILADTSDSNDVKEKINRLKKSLNVAQQELLEKIALSFEPLLTKLRTLQDNKSFMYRKAAPVAGKLIEEITEHLQSLHQNKISIDDFYKNCERSVNKVRPVLEKHRGLKMLQEVFAAIACALVVVATVFSAGLSAGMTAVIGLLTSVSILDIAGHNPFVSSKTATAELLDDIIPRGAGMDLNSDNGAYASLPFGSS